MPKPPDPHAAFVFTSPDMRKGRIVGTKTEETTTYRLVEFATAGNPRHWVLDGQCYLREQVPDLIQTLRREVDYLTQRIDVLESWLERQAIQEESAATS